jgi:hypothetical protein
LGSEPTFAAVAHEKNWIAAPSVRFLHVEQFNLQLQRRAAFRPSCQNVHAAASVTIRPCCRSWFLSQSNFAIAAKAGLVRVFTVQNDALSGCFLDQP